MAGHKKALSKPLEPIIPPLLKVKIQKRTRTKELGKTQPRLLVGIATKKATIQINM